MQKEKSKLVQETKSKKLNFGGFNDFLSLGGASQCKVACEIKKSLNVFSGYQEILAHKETMKKDKNEKREKNKPI